MEVQVEAKVPNLGKITHMQQYQTKGRLIALGQVTMAAETKKWRQLADHYLEVFRPQTARTKTQWKVSKTTTPLAAKTWSPYLSVKDWRPSSSTSKTQLTSTIRWCMDSLTSATCNNRLLTDRLSIKQDYSNLRQQQAEAGMQKLTVWFRITSKDPTLVLCSKCIKDNPSQAEHQSLSSS